MLITSNDPSAGYVSWSGIQIKYKGVTYTVADGNSNKKFIWWDFTTPTVFLDSDTMPTMTDNDFIAILNDSGTYTLIGIRSRQVHGDVILAGTVPATALEETYVETTGDETIAGIKTFSSFPITPSSSPTTNYQVANKKYVDDNGGGASDHGALTGLADDDHSQYHNNTRGDARYKQIGDAPTAHKVSHQIGGSDNIKIDDLTQADDNTDLNVSNSAHGLMPKLTDVDNKWFDASGNYTTPKIIGQFIFGLASDMTVSANVTIELFPATTLTITEVYISVKTAPTDASLIVDVNKNGTTIFTTQGNRPEIADGATSDTSGAPDVTALTKNDKLAIDIDQIGSTNPGKDLTVCVRFEQEVT